MLVAIAAGATLAAWGLGRELGGELGAWLGALWFATTRMFIERATLPYQEGLFFLAMFAGLALYGRGERGSARARRGAALMLNLACMTRYEGWILVGVLAFDGWLSERREGRVALRRAITEFLTHGGALALAWLVLGSFELSENEAAFEQRASLGAFAQVVREYAGFAWRHGAGATFALAALGWVWALRDPRSRSMARRRAVFLAVDVALVLVVDPFAGSRRVFMALAIAALFAGQGLARGLRALCERALAGQLPRTLAGVTLVVSILVASLHVAPSVRAGLGDVERRATEPTLARAHEAGTWIAEHLEVHSGGLAVVQDYVQVFALQVWTSLPVEGKPQRWSNIARPDFVVDLGGDAAELESCLAQLRGRAAVELVYSSPGAPEPRIWRVTW